LQGALPTTSLGPASAGVGHGRAPRAPLHPSWEDTRHVWLAPFATSTPTVRVAPAVVDQPSEPPSVGSSGGTAGCGAPGIHHRNFVGSDRPALAPEYPLHVAIFPVRRRVGGSGGWVRLPILFSCCCVQGFPGYSSERARVIGWMFECIERKRCVTLSRSGCVFCFFSLLCRLTRSGCVLCFYCKSAAPRGLSSAKWWLQDAGAGERASRNVGKAADREPIESPV